MIRALISCISIITFSFGALAGNEGGGVFSQLVLLQNSSGNEILLVNNSTNALDHKAFETTADAILLISRDELDSIVQDPADSKYSLNNFGIDGTYTKVSDF